MSENMDVNIIKLKGGVIVDKNELLKAQIIVGTPGKITDWI
jgi:superfamily II DNA/RNA helicase